MFRPYSRNLLWAEKLSYVLWAAVFGLLAWGAWAGVTVTEPTLWWAKPAGLAAGLLALWIGVGFVGDAWDRQTR